MTLYAVLTHTRPKTKPLTANVSDMLRRRCTCSGHSEYAGLEGWDMTILPFEPTNREIPLVPSISATAIQQLRLQSVGLNHSRALMDSSNCREQGQKARTK